MITLTEFLEEFADMRGWQLMKRLALICAIAWLPAQILSYLISAIYPGPRGADVFATSLRAVAMGILLAPLLETLAMRWGFWALRKLRLGKRSMLWVSAVSWGGAHFYSGSWGIPAIWVFFVFGVIYLKADQQSSDRALLVTAAVHATFNAWSYALYLGMRNVA